MHVFTGSVSIGVTPDKIGELPIATGVGSGSSWNVYVSAKPAGSVGMTTGSVGMNGGLSSLTDDDGTSELLSEAVTLGEGVSDEEGISEVFSEVIALESVSDEDGISELLSEISVLWGDSEEVIESEKSLDTLGVDVEDASEDVTAVSTTEELAPIGVAVDSEAGGEADCSVGNGTPVEGPEMGDELAMDGDCTADCDADELRTEDDWTAYLEADTKLGFGGVADFVEGSFDEAGFVDSPCDAEANFVEYPFTEEAGFVETRLDDEAALVEVLLEEVAGFVDVRTALLWEELTASHFPYFFWQAFAAQ